MYNCADDLTAYHNDKVTLPQQERTAMRDCRNANRDRLTGRLKETDEPIPEMFIKQGSYAMLTMVQDDDNDYDIDDGVYFKQELLKLEDGTYMGPRKIKEIVCEALRDDRFKKQPQVRKACVRVFYNEGYHVDMPVYRIRIYDGQYELADDSGWTPSRAADVEEWFNRENEKSPDEDNGRQFRRIVRYVKKFARSRKEWKDGIASGFTITKLVSECYTPNKDREDIALRNTMKAIYTRLRLTLEVSHPVTPQTKLTKGPEDAGCLLLREKLRDALSELDVLDNTNCTPKQALGAWNRAFNTTFFSERLDKAAESRPGFSSAPSSLKSATVSTGLSFPNHPVVPNKPAGFA